MRVSSLRELEEAFDGLPNAGARAERLSAFLGEVFETEFSFDLDKQLLKKGLKLAAKQLASYQAANDYIGAWVMQRSLGGHAIPLDAPTLRCGQRLGLLDGSQDDADARASLEHLVPKAKGALFTDLISCLADKYCWEEEPHCSACPMARECGYAHENGVEQLTAVGGRRAQVALKRTHNQPRASISAWPRATGSQPNRLLALAAGGCLRLKIVNPPGYFAAVSAAWKPQPRCEPSQNGLVCERPAAAQGATAALPPAGRDELVAQVIDESSRLLWMT